MTPDRRTAAAAQGPAADASEPEAPATPELRAVEPAAAGGTLEERIERTEANRAAAEAAGQTVKAERLAERLEEMKKVARQRAEQEMLERADAGLPPAPPGDGAAPQAAPAAAAQPAAQPAPRPAADPALARPPAEPSSPKPRHWMVLFSFLILVILPTALAGWYLWNRATDRYVSYAGFSVRTEEIGSAIELLGGVADLSGSSSSDPTILYAFIQSQEMVRRIDKLLDLRSLWAKADPEIDPIFAYHPPGTIEDMTEYWERRVKVYNDDGGLIDLEVQAFAPEDARAIAAAIYDQSSEMINRLSAIAREDSTGHARDELEKAVEDLRQARVAMTQFRNRTQIVDPSASLQSQMGILASLQQQLATAMIDIDLLREQGVSDSDPRLAQGQRRVEVIEERIAEERRKLGIGTAEGTAVDENAFANLVGEYESLQVDLQFAQESYTAARAAYEAAVAEARRQSRYLAAHVTPTLPEKAEHPQRVTLLGLVALFSFLFWAMAVLTAYALRDRR